MPLIVSIEYGAGDTPLSRLVNTRLPARAGSIACSPFAPVPRVTLNVSTREAASHEIPVNDDPLRPSSHVSICRADTTGTPRASADVTIASEPAFECLPS